MNWNVIKAFTEMRKDGDKIKGQSFRITLSDDRGNYLIMPKPSEKITATQVKEALKEAPDLDAIVTNTLRKAMEGIAVARALDSDDEPEAPVASSNGKSSAKTSKSKAKAKGKAEWPDEAEDLEVTVATVNDGNTIEVSSDEYDGETLVYGTTGKNGVDFTDLDEGATITLSYATDEDGDKVASAFEEAAGSSEPDDEPEEDEEVQEAAEGDLTPGDDLPENIADEQFEVVEAPDEADYSVLVTNGDLTFKLYVLEGTDIDWDDYTVGTKIVVNAQKDTVDDMLSTEAPKIVKAKSSAKGAKKGGAKKKGA